MAIGKKISLGQIIGIDGENEVKCWLSKSCKITASKIENDFGIDLIGQWRGASTDSSNSSWLVNPIPISIAVRTTASEKGKIIIDKPDAKVLLDNPCIFLVVPHFYTPEHAFYAKFITPDFINELNAFIKGSKSTKTITIKNCICDVDEINKQIQLLLAPAYAEKIKMYKIRIGLQQITSSGEIIINHGDGDSYALINTNNFNEFFASHDDKLRQDMVWGGMKYFSENMRAFNSSRKFKKDLVDFLHSLPVSKAILFGSDDMFRDKEKVCCRVQSTIDKTEASCEFCLRISDNWIGLWHPTGFAIKAAEVKKLPDGTHVHDIESHIDSKVTFSDVFGDKDLAKFLQHCRDIDGAFFWDDFQIPIRSVPDFCNAGMLIYLYESLKELGHDFIPAETKLNQITDEDLRGLSMLYLLIDLSCIGDLELKLTDDITSEVPLYNVELPLCFNVLGHGVICWLKRTAHLLQNERKFFVGIKMGAVTGFEFEKRNTPFSQCDYPFIGIRKEWPSIIILDDGHARVQNLPMTDDLQMKFTFEP